MRFDALHHREVLPVAGQQRQLSTPQSNDGRRESVVDTIQGLASGEKSGQFVQNADLAKISWLSLFVRQLFPPNTWADRVRRLSVRDP